MAKCTSASDPGACVHVKADLQFLFFPILAGVCHSSGSLMIMMPLLPFTLTRTSITGSPLWSLCRGSNLPPTRPEQILWHCVFLQTTDMLQLCVSLSWILYFRFDNVVFMLWLGLGTKQHLVQVGKYHVLAQKSEVWVHFFFLNISLSFLVESCSLLAKHYDSLPLSYDAVSRLAEATFPLLLVEVTTSQGSKKVPSTSCSMCFHRLYI